MLTEQQIKKATNIRISAAGYIGGIEIADKATLQEVLTLADLQDEHAKLYNQLWANERTQTNITALIKERG